MVTRWIPAHRADLGLHAGDLTTSPLTVTNRGWYLLRQFLVAAGARSTEQLAGRDVYIPVGLANHWGATLTSADTHDWLQVGRWNGQAVVAAGITHRDLASVYLDTHELTPLADTPAHAWLASVGMHLTTTPSGLVITATPVKENQMTGSNLTKGDKTDLTKEAGGTLTKVRIGLGWDARTTTGADYDLDGSIIGCDTAEKGLSHDWFIYYGRLKSPGNAVVHQGDNLTGRGDGDDEQIIVDLQALPAEVDSLAVAVTIYQAQTRGKQSFGQVRNAFIRIVDESTGAELTRYDLSEDAGSGVNAMVFGKLYRRGDSWNFRAVGDGFTDELPGLMANYKLA